MSQSMTTAPARTGGLDEVMLAMDVVDTLRHRQHIVDQELDTESREEVLISRLREIYAAQGIEVPDHVLREGVSALEERRFLYEPPKPSLSVSLAKLYINRDRWMKPVAIGLAFLVGASTLHNLTIAGPQRARAAQVEQELTVSLPAELASLRESVLGAATEDSAIELAETLYVDGQQAIAEEDIKAAREARDDLVTLGSDLSAQFDVTVVSRPGEMSGVFRIPDDTPTARNYYLIVEALDARGRKLEVTITSEEDQSTRRVTQWGQRVPQGVFNSVAADKQDDQIIQNAVIGTKIRGRLTPTFTVPVEDGAILEW